MNLLAVCQLAEDLAFCRILYNYTTKHLRVTWLSHVSREPKTHFGMDHMRLATCRMNIVPVAEHKVLIERGRESLYWYDLLPLKSRDGNCPLIFHIEPRRVSNTSLWTEPKLQQNAAALRTLSQSDGFPVRSLGALDDRCKFFDKFINQL